jgi:hypothetical protein
MKVGDLVKMKGPTSQYGWRQGASEGTGIIITDAHRTAKTMQGCSVFWSACQKIQDVPEDWLEMISESR